MRLGGGAAAQTKRQDPHVTLPSALRQHDNVADPYEVVGLLYRQAIDRDGSGGAQPRRQRAAFDETGKPQPLIEAGLGALRTGSDRAQANFSSFSLAKGWPSRGRRGRLRLSGVARRRGFA